MLNISFTVGACCHPLWAFLLNVIVQRSPFNGLTTAFSAKNINELTGGEMVLSENKAGKTKSSFEQTFSFERTLEIINIKIFQISLCEFIQRTSVANKMALGTGHYLWPLFYYFSKRSYVCQHERMHVYLNFVQFSYPWALFTILDSSTFHSKLVDFPFCKIIIKNLKQQYKINLN